MVAATVLFELPQTEIASRIESAIAQSTTTRIVTGFATPGGLTAISGPLQAAPKKLKTLVVGAATYPAFEVLDSLISWGVSASVLRVHLGHTFRTGGRKHPFARYHPMLHSKIYLMELPGRAAKAFVGSNNLTSFALAGLNGEAAVLLEGGTDDPAFVKIRQHIVAAEAQAVQYSSNLKSAFSWWFHEFVDGLAAEIKVPHDWATTRTILIFVQRSMGLPRSGDFIYFEIPSGVEQIESLRTEAHLFVFDALPSDPLLALNKISSATARFRCVIHGVENRQGNKEVAAQWRVEAGTTPLLSSIPTGSYRPSTPEGMQQVRALVEDTGLLDFEYRFEREKGIWEPVLSSEESGLMDASGKGSQFLVEARGGERGSGDWRLVKGLAPKEGPAKETDEVALRLVAPESGSFVLVAVQRRLREQQR